MLGTFRRGDLVFHGPTKRFGTVVKTPLKTNEYVLVNFEKVGERREMEMRWGMGGNYKTRTNSWFRLIALTQAKAIKKSEIESPAHGTICSPAIHRAIKITDTITF